MFVTVRRQQSQGSWDAADEVVKERCQDAQRMSRVCVLRMSLRACRSVSAPTLAPDHHLKQSASQLKGSPTSCCQIPQNMQTLHLVRSPHAVPASLTHPRSSIRSSSSSSDQSADRKPEGHRAGRGLASLVWNRCQDVPKMHLRRNYRSNSSTESSENSLTVTKLAGSKSALKTDESNR